MLDAVQVEVIHHYWLSAAQEMRRTLIRTAFNPVVYEVLDFGISIFDGQLNLIAEAPGLTFFLGANDYAIKKGVAYVGEENIDPGDVILLNYPYWNSAHTLDVTLFAPVFSKGGSKPFAYTCIRAHWMDLGAKDAGYVLDSTDVHQEGLIFPGTKLYRKGELNQEILELIRFNSRMPDLVRGDLDAQLAATKTGQRRLLAIFDKFGQSQLQEASRVILEHGERLTRRSLASLPHGKWRAADYLDNDDDPNNPIPMSVSVEVQKDLFRVDFTGSSAAVPAPVNIPFGRTETLCKVVLKSLTTPDSPTNAGNFRALEVVAPEGSLFHAVYPAPTFTLWSSTVALELVFKALAKGMPEHLAASSGGDVPGFMMVGKHPQTDRLYAVSNNDSVGWGATREHDGRDATSHLAQTLVRNTPVEILEMKTGMFVESLELREDSGGVGTFRGGLGLKRQIRFQTQGEFLSVMKKTQSRPWSLCGGGEPEPNQMVFFAGTDQERRVGTYRSRVQPGDRCVNLTAGGGGYGDPFKRDPRLVLEDVLDGRVSKKAAKDDYGVCIRNQRVDETSTQRVRTQRHTGTRRKK